MQTKTTANWDPRVPFNALPPPPATADLITPEVQEQSDRVMTAHRRIEKFMRSDQTIWDKQTAWLTVPAIEAIASSKIEGIYTTPLELIQGRARRPVATGQVRDTLNLEDTIRATWDGFGSLGDTTRSATRACSKIKGYEMAVRDRPGTVIGGPQGIVYTPPYGNVRLNDMLQDLWRFLEAEDQENQLSRIAAGHYQFEAIHPFEDGNGRTGRLINLIYLGRATFSATPYCAPSTYILRHVQTYYELLTRMRQRSCWEAWILFMLRAFEAGIEYIEGVIERQTAISAGIRAELPIGNDELTRAVSRRPYLTARSLVDGGIVRSDATARKHLRKLRDDGFLTEHKGGRVGAIFANPRVIESWT